MKLLKAIVIIFTFSNLAMARYIDNSDLQQSEVQNVQGVPEWYSNASVAPRYNNEMIAYGKGSSMREAREAALADLSKLNNSDIKVVDTIHKDSYLIKSKVTSDVTVKANMQVSSKIEVIRVAHDVSESKSTWISNEDVDYPRWYCAIAYDPRPVQIQVLDIADKLKPATKLTFLNKSRLGKELERILGFNPSISLVQTTDDNHKELKLFIGKYEFPSSSWEFQDILVSAKHSDIAMEFDNYEYKEREDIRIRVYTKDEGYITLIKFDDGGEPLIIADNVKIEHELTLETSKVIGLSTNYVSGKKYADNIMYTAVYSKYQIDTSKIRNVLDSYIRRGFIKTKVNARDYSHFADFIDDNPIMCSNIVPIISRGNRIMVAPANDDDFRGENSIYVGF